MSRKEKLLQKTKNNPKGLSFNEFETLLKQYGWICDHQRGSHRMYLSPQKFRLPIQPKGNMAKEYQVKQFLGQLEREEK